MRCSRGRGSIRWIAKAGGKYVGSFDTEKLAAQAVAKKLQIQVARLLKKASGSRGVKRKRISGSRARALFKAAYPVFKKYVAADYSGLTDMETRFARLFRQDL